MKKGSYNPFDSIMVEQQGTNRFDLSHDNKLSLKMGGLYPTLTEETYPGDYFHINAAMMMRFAPMLRPIMHRVDVTMHFFYVPNRIMNYNWPNFLKGEAVTPPVFQSAAAGAREFNSDVGSIHDYLDLPPISDPGAYIDESVSAFPYLAYLRIYNEYYQDQNNDSSYIGVRDLLEDLLSDDGVLDPQGFFDVGLTSNNKQYPQGILKRCWEHDYFTSCLPEAQKGDAVNIPVELVSLTGSSVSSFAALTGTTTPATGDVQSTAGFLNVDGTTPIDILGDVIIDTDAAELSGRIVDLRGSEALQKFLEINSRSGTRYNELIDAHFGVDIGDARINRPEYIGGIKNNIQFSEVLQTSQSTEDSALGDFAGHGVGVISGESITFKCPEHGWIMGIMSVMPKTGYYQGIPKKYSRKIYTDMYWKEFAHIGEQAVLNKEIFFEGLFNQDNAEFGYIVRDSPLKTRQNIIHGDFKTTLLDWHLVRKFDELPTLSKEFVECNPSDRIFAVQDGSDNLWCHVFFDIEASRKIPFYSTPGNVL